MTATLCTCTECTVLLDPWLLCYCVVLGAAVRKLLELLQGSLGYDSICLFADKDKPHIGAMYKVSLRTRCQVIRALW